MTASSTNVVPLHPPVVHRSSPAVIHTLGTSFDMRLLPAVACRATARVRPQRCPHPLSTGCGPGLCGTREMVIPSMRAAGVVSRVAWPYLSAKCSPPRSSAYACLGNGGYAANAVAGQTRWQGKRGGRANAVAGQTRWQGKRGGRRDGREWRGGIAALTARARRCVAQDLSSDNSADEPRTSGPGRGAPDRS
jgi:hypothetical protein